MSNTDRIIKTMADGDTEAFDQYLKILLRGSVTPDWPALFKYWLSEPCRSCLGSGEVPLKYGVPQVQLFDRPPCTSCNGTGKTTVKDIVGLHLDFTHNLRFNSSPHKFNMMIVWAYVATSDYNARTERGLMRSEKLCPDHALRLTYAVYNFYSDPASHYKNTSRKHNTGLIHIAVSMAVNAGVIERVHDYYYVITDSMQPKIKALEALRNKHNMSWLPRLKRKHWLLGYVHRNGRIKKITVRKSNIRSWDGVSGESSDRYKITKHYSSRCKSIR